MMKGRNKLFEPGDFGSGGIMKEIMTILNDFGSFVRNDYPFNSIYPDFAFNNSTENTFPLPRSDRTPTINEQSDRLEYL